MTTAETKARRLAAAEKAEEAATEKLVNLRAAVTTAEGNLARAQHHLAWIRAMPVDVVEPPVRTDDDGA